MIRFALIVASALGFALTAAVGNLLVPLLRAFAPAYMLPGKLVAMDMAFRFRQECFLMKSGMV